METVTTPVPCPHPTPPSTQPPAPPPSLSQDERFLRLDALLLEMRALFPGTNHVSVSFTGNGVGEFRCATVSYFEPKTIAAATEWFRQWGVKEREKRPQAGSSALHDYTVMRGSNRGVEFVTFPDELPATCRKVEVTRRVSKTAVTALEGEFIEVRETKIVCGGGDHGVAPSDDATPAALTNGGAPEGGTL